MPASDPAAASPRLARLTLTAATTADGLRDACERLHDAGQADLLVFEIQPGAGAREAGPLDWLAWCELPVVASFEGALADTAAAIALACDIRVCGRDATLTPPASAARRLRRLLRDDDGVLQTVAGAGKPLMAQQLLDAGLVGAIASAGEANAAALRVAETMLKRGPIALRLAKEAIWRGLEMPLEQALRFETDLTLLLQTTKDRAEGVHAFLEKREPRFTGD